MTIIIRNFILVIDLSKMESYNQSKSEREFP